MDNESIFVTRSSMPPFEEYVEKIKSIWDTCILTNMGPIHKTFENDVLKYLNVENITLFNNGHSALEIAIQALNLSGEVITTPFTFASTTHAIVRNGLKPVFCDINENDYTIDISKIEPLINEKTSAIIPVHVYGNICDVEAIEKIAEKYNLKVIYDAAHAFGVKFNEIGIGNYGDISMFSFHATKVFNTIEGGALTFKNKEYSFILNNLKNFGIVSAENIVLSGANAKMNEFQAAMGLCNLKYIDENIQSRKEAFTHYINILSDIKGIKVKTEQAGVTQNYSYFPIVVDENIFKENRNQIFEKLKKENINARKYFYPLVNDFECYKTIYSSYNTPVAKQIADRVLSLPIYSQIQKQEIERICEIILRK